MLSNQEKFFTVTGRNTFYFHNPIFQEKYEAYVNSLKETLLVLKSEVEAQGLKKGIFENLLAHKEHGLRGLLALTGFSNENFKRLITMIRIAEDAELSRLVFKEKWAEKENLKGIKEWSDVKIERLVLENAFFRKGIVNLFFEGATTPFLADILPLFELKKLSVSKLKFEISAIFDTLVRYKEKGSYAGQAENNPEALIKSILDEFEIPFEKGDLPKLLQKERLSKRSMDFIVPDKKSPKLIIECSFLATTSSGQGDKSKTESGVAKLIKEHYPQACSLDLWTALAGTFAKAT